MTRSSPRPAMRSGADHGSTLAENAETFCLWSYVMADRPSGDACLSCGSVEFSTVRGYRNESAAGRRLFRSTVIRECGRCGLCQVGPVPGDDELTRYYATDYRAGRRY